MRIVLVSALIVALATPAAAVVTCSDLGCVGVLEGNQLAYYDGPGYYPDPVDGFVSVAPGAACYDEDGSPDDGNPSNGPESTSPTCVPLVPGVPPLAVCYPYNPGALTNACMGVGSDPEVVQSPPVTTPPVSVCVIGDLCASLPGMVLAPGMTHVVPVPAPYGYAEATALCGVVAACGVTLP